MSRLRMVFTKWGGLPHWEYDADLLGEDEHGTWLGVPHGTVIARPGARIRTGQHQVILVPDAGFVATFFARDGHAPQELYVDISTVPRIGDGTVSAVDLDLDVLRDWRGRVRVDDEDEFVDHRVRFGYPDDVVEHATRTCEKVRRAAELSQAPFDPATSRRWLDLAGDAMMSP